MFLKEAFLDQVNNKVLKVSKVVCLTYRCGSRSGCGLLLLLLLYNDQRVRRDTSMALRAAASRGDMIGAGPLLGGDSEPAK